MKKTEIEVGHSYTDNKGSVRLVVAAGPEFVLYRGQECTDNLRYLLVAKKRGPFEVGKEYNSTRANFATWAKARVA